jgi:hypothetical protein
MSMWRNMIVAGVTVVLGLGAAGCNTPCKQIRKAQWICNLAVVDPVEPGSLIYVTDGQFGRVRLPDSVAGFSVKSEDANIADVMHTSNWSFGIDAGLPGLPGSSGLALKDVKARLKRTGYKKIDFKFEDEKVNSLASENGQGPRNLEEAKKLADAYIDALTPRNRSAAGRQKPNGTVYLVMQTYTSKVTGTFESGGAVEAGAEGVLADVASKLKVEGGGNSATTQSVNIAKPLPIAYRAIPLAIIGGGAGLEAPPDVRVKATKYAGPR